MSHASSLPYARWATHAGRTVLTLGGPWTLEHDACLGELLGNMPGHTAAALQVHTLDTSALDLGGITELDTAGADRLAELLGPVLPTYLEAPHCALTPARCALVRTVIAARHARGPLTQIPAVPAWRELLERTGQSAQALARETVALLQFMGITLEAFAKCLPHPKRWRITSLVANIEESTLNAVPIVALLTFMVGAVIAFLGATILAGFGASIYTVNLVTFSFLREFAGLLAAILVAGRTASAYTAQLGSMKVNEEIDAIRMQGLNPVELLVLPRVAALLVGLPLLTFVGMMFGILGGIVIGATTLDISSSMFLSIFQDKIPVRHFLIGMCKAPVFAFFIALIGCQQGLNVSGSAQSVGRHTTSAVVQSISVVIFIDALAALFFMEMGW